MLKKIVAVALLAIFICTMSKAADAVKNLLKNGSLSLVKSNKMPIAWFAPQKEVDIHDFFVDSMDRPAGCKNSFKIVVKKAFKNQGSLAQYIKDFNQNSEYLFSGTIRSSKNRMAFLQVKLLKAGKELKRISSKFSDKKWQTVSIRFSSGDADTIVVIFRFLQSEKFVGEVACFADLKLVEVN
ncbi:MAG: hypothetical protein L3J71_13675 [Victivallaceae bacterium]|nr:hypothetical protein [Victivallaceae bacterium]